MTGSIENRYRGEAGRRYQQAKRAVPAEAFPWVARLRAEKFQPCVKPTDTVIELGAGLGWNLAQLPCARRIATDLENHLPQNSNIEFAQDSASIPSETAQVLICHHVLEHVADPPSMLAEAARLLQRDGLLLLNVPFETETRYRHFDPSEPNHHLYSWNVQTLGNLVTDCGFQIRQLRPRKFGYDRAAAAFAVRFHLGESGFRLLRRVALLVRPAYEIQLRAQKAGGAAAKFC